MRSSIPKVLHQVCGREMVVLAVEAIRKAGIERIIAVVPLEADAIRRLLGSSVEYVVQEKPLGTGHALLQARSLLGDVGNVLVAYGDVPLICPETLGQMMALHQDKSASLTLLTSTGCPLEGLGRVLRGPYGKVAAVVEEKDAGPATLDVTEVNSGIYCLNSQELWERLARLSPSSGGEVYLTDLVSVADRDGATIEAVVSEDPWEVLGVNDRIQLAQAEEAMRRRIRERCMIEGVTLIEPGSAYIDATVEIGRDTVVYPNTHIGGETKIGNGCLIGPNSLIYDSVVGDGCRVQGSMVEESILGDGVRVGPFSHIRAGSHIGSDVHIGNYAEIKKSRLGRGTKMGHFSYVGDAILGTNVNVGAGTVTCNFDGRKKNQTVVGDDVFIGSDSMLIAPIRIGERSTTGAGSVVTQDVPPDSMAVGVPARITPKRRAR